MILKFQDMVAVESFIQQHATDKMPVSAAFKLNKILRAISGDLQFFRDRYTTLLQTCGEKDENGELVVLENGNYKIKDEATFEKGVKEIMDEEVVYNDLSCVKLVDLQDIQISIAELSAVMPIIEE